MLESPKQSRIQAETDAQSVPGDWFPLKTGCSGVFEMAKAVHMDSKNGIQVNHAAWIGLMPPVPCRLLLLSDRPDGYAQDLAALGFDVRHSPLCIQNQYAQQPTATRAGICQVEVALSEAERNSYCGVLVEGLSPHVHPLGLFDELIPWLVDGAVIVLSGYNPKDPSQRTQNWLDNVISIAIRCGFEQELLDQPEHQDDDGYFVRILRKIHTPRWQLHHVRERDFDRIANLFSEVFEHPLSRDLWNWKYGQGRGNAVTAVRHGVVVAHYGGMYREVLMCGEPEWVFQICDVMVHPKERGVMTRQGPFLLTAATSAEVYGPLGFGFPNSRAMLVAEKMGLYSEVGQMVSLRWMPAAPGFRWRTRARALVRSDLADQKRVNSLWSDMASDLQNDVVGVRDWRYLEDRYFNHPHNHYDPLLVTSRLTGKSLGVAILRRLEDTCELLDVIAPLNNLPLVVDQARRVAGLWGLPSLYCWIAKNQVQRFASCNGVEEVLNISIPTSCWTNDARATVFKNRWWLMSGDTDFR